MFHSLRYAVTFPSTGRTLSADLNFDTGFSSITGDNETGKTMILEMLRFLLWGSTALRGRSEDYRTLQAAGELSIRGVRYGVDRTMRKATLRRGEETIASGVSAVNEKIAQLFGYGITVFDVANSINQGDVERLGSMSPAERKRMVDSVLGIDALDLVTRWGLEEARLLDREAETLRRTAVPPVPPTKPEGYVASSTVDLPALRAAAQELAQIEGFLSVQRAAPVKPAGETSEELAKARADLRNELAALRARAAALPASVPYSEEQLAEAEQGWAAFHAYTAALQWLGAHPAPSYTVEQLQSMRDAWDLIEAHDNHDAQQKRVAAIEAQIAAADRVSCPECSHSFALHQEHVAQLQEQLASERELLEIGDPGYVRPVTPALGLQQIGVQERIVASDDPATRATMQAVPAATRPAVAEHQIPVFRAQIEQAAQRATIEASLAELQAQFDAMPDYEALLLAQRAYDQALPEYEAWVAQRDAKQARAAALQGARERLAEGERIHAVSAAYEAALDRYGADYDRYATTMQEVERLEGRAAEYRKVRDVMNVLRSLIKQHLLPSLNRVASHLLSRMTGGQRTAIYVSEDFDVVVDRQPLDTLSGSGKACANLALRIALGQVLTNRVFSVLLADEVDASMDDFRAEQTSNVLCMLENTISQVLLVSHKPIESTNRIELGVSSAERASLYGEAA